MIFLAMIEFICFVVYYYYDIIMLVCLVYRYIY